MVHMQETMYFVLSHVGCNVCMKYIINENFNNICDNCNKLTKKELLPILKYVFVKHNCNKNLVFLTLTRTW